MPTPSQPGQNRALEVLEGGPAGQRLHGTSQAAREGADRGCSRVRWAWGVGVCVLVLRLPPWNRHAGATARRLQRLWAKVAAEQGCSRRRQLPACPSGQHSCPEVPCWKTAALSMPRAVVLESCIVLGAILPPSPQSPHRGRRAALPQQPRVSLPRGYHTAIPRGSSSSHRGVWGAMRASGGLQSGPVLEEIFRMGERL